VSPRPKQRDRSEPIRVSVANFIEEAVLTGEFLPGREVPQLLLAKRLGVSQSSIREGLQDLEYRGMIRKRARSWIVTQLAQDELADLYEVRALLEPRACKLAAVTWTETATAEIEGCLRQMKEAADKQNYREHWRADVEFHRIIWRNQPNRALERELNAVCMPLFADGVLKQTRVPASSYARSIAYHALMVNLLRTRNADRIEQVVMRLVRNFHRLNLHDFWKGKADRD
jgi:DNA-binding GntR family transcriptional regulator